MMFFRLRLNHKTGINIQVTRVHIFRKMNISEHYLLYIRFIINLKIKQNMRITKIFFAVSIAASTLFFSCKPKDSDVQAKITEKFAATPEVAGATATVADGVATLSGEVSNPEAQAQAETLAKEIKGVKSVVNNLTVTPPPPPPVVSPDAALEQGVTDATKDFPTVKASVSNGEITLTGTIKRADLQKLMQTLNTLNPSKINNQLTIK